MQQQVIPTLLVLKGLQSSTIKEEDGCLQQC